MNAMLSDSPPRASAVTRKQLLLAAALLLAADVLFFGHVVGFEFVTEDDTLFIAANPVITHWSEASWTDRLLTTRFTYAAPVTVGSFALDWSLWSGRPAGFHLTNLLLHWLSALLLFVVARRLVPTGPALAGAMLFLLHPLQAEAVGFVTQRKDILAALFSLLALDRLLAADTARRPFAQWTLAWLAILCAGLSKPTALLLGPMLALVVWLNRGELPRVSRRRLLLGLILALPTLGLSLLDLHVHKLMPHTLELEPLTGTERLALIAHTWVHYARSLVAPWDLSPKVPRPELHLAAGPICLSAVTLVALAALLVLCLRRRARAGTLILLWCAGSYLMVGNFVPLSRYVADSQMHLPLVGLALGLSLLVERVAVRAPDPRLQRLPVACSLLLTVGLGILAQRQAAVWRDEDTLFAHLYHRYPENTEAVMQYAKHLAAHQRQAESRAVLLDFYGRALQAQPASLAARHRLMRLHLDAGDAASARRVLTEAPPSGRGTIAYWEAWLELGMRQRDFQVARESARHIVALDPRSPRRELLRQLEGLRPR